MGWGKGEEVGRHGLGEGEGGVSACIAPQRLGGGEELGKAHSPPLHTPPHTHCMQEQVSVSNVLRMLVSSPCMQEGGREGGEAGLWYLRVCGGKPVCRHTAAWVRLHGMHACVTWALGKALCLSQALTAC